MKTLDFAESIKLAEKHGLPFVKSVEIKKESELKKMRLRYPVALKAVSPKILHKTEHNAVRVNLKNEKEVLSAFRQLKKLPAFKKAIAQEMISGHELIIGAKKDPIFGHVILVGFGGIFTEVMKDFSLRIAPIQKQDAVQMLSELKAFKLLKGYRGKKKANIASIVSFIMKVNKMLEKEPWIKELDFNPVFADEKKTQAVDVRIIG